MPHHRRERGTLDRRIRKGGRRGRSRRGHGCGGCRAARVCARGRHRFNQGEQVSTHGARRSGARDRSGGVMPYWLHEFAEGATNDLLKALNVFQYVTFRAVMAALTSFVLSLLLGNFTIRKLLSLKFGQPI